jgi:hypothetical protein
MLAQRTRQTTMVGVGDQLQPALAETDQHDGTARQTRNAGQLSLRFTALRMRGEYLRSRGSRQAITYIHSSFLAHDLELVRR